MTTPYRAPSEHAVRFVAVGDPRWTTSRRALLPWISPNVALWVCAALTGLSLCVHEPLRGSYVTPMLFTLQCALAALFARRAARQPTNAGASGIVDDEGIEVDHGGGVMTRYSWPRIAHARLDARTLVIVLDRGETICALCSETRDAVRAASMIAARASGRVRWAQRGWTWLVATHACLMLVALLRA